MLFLKVTKWLAENNLLSRSKETLRQSFTQRSSVFSSELASSSVSLKAKIGVIKCSYYDLTSIRIYLSITYLGIELVSNFNSKRLCDRLCERLFRCNSGNRGNRNW